uniref:Uncharacterized protein n=1 Tax=Clastoptera arizonana TaxID=38151 RepID=A0A1B6DK37_9HEMI
MMETSFLHIRNTLQFLNSPYLELTDGELSKGFFERCKLFRDLIRWTISKLIDEDDDINVYFKKEETFDTDLINILHHLQITDETTNKNFTLGRLSIDRQLKVWLDLLDFAKISNTIDEDIEVGFDKIMNILSKKPQYLESTLNDKTIIEKTTMREITRDGAIVLENEENVNIKVSSHQFLYKTF